MEMSGIVGIHGSSSFWFGCLAAYRDWGGWGRRLNKYQVTEYGGFQLPLRSALART